MGAAICMKLSCLPCMHVHLSKSEKKVQFFIGNEGSLPSMTPINLYLEQNVQKIGSFLETKPYFHLNDTSFLGQ